MYPLQCNAGPTAGDSQTLLAPSGWLPTPRFRHTGAAPARHGELIAGLQRFRGQAYLRDGAIRPSNLTADGRHDQPADYESWHLLTHNSAGELIACARYHPLKNPSFESTAVSRSALGRSPEWRPKVRAAVEHSILAAASRSLHFAELGGWCVAPSARHTSLALRSVLFMFALGDALGGTVGLSTATRRHASASILQRLGAQRASLPSGEPLPSYFDPQFDCEMELLVFNSLHPAPKYAAPIASLRHNILTATPILTPAAPGSSLQSLASMLQALQPNIRLSFDWETASQKA